MAFSAIPHQIKLWYIVKYLISHTTISDWRLTIRREFLGSFLSIGEYSHSVNAGKSQQCLAQIPKTC